MSCRFVPAARMLLIAAVTVAPVAWGQRFSELRWGGTIYTNQALQDPLHGYWQLRMQGDCNLVLYHHEWAQWATNTNGRGSNCRAVMQIDGNFVVYSGSTPVWASGTVGWTWAKLRLYADGGLYIANAPNDSPLWWINIWEIHTANTGQEPWTNVPGGQLGPNQTLYNGDVLSSPGGNYKLDMQSDCNLVIYTRSEIWQPREYWSRFVRILAQTYPPDAIADSDTRWRSAECRAVMQSDGNFVIYDYAGRVMTATGTNVPWSVLRMQDDGNLVIYDPSGRAVWSSGTENSR